MSQNRRTFLRNAALLAGATGLAPLGNALPGQTNTIVPESQLPSPQSLIPVSNLPEEDIWKWVRQQFSSFSGIVNLNNAVISPSPKPVEDAFFRLTTTANLGPAMFMKRMLSEGIGSVKRKLAAMLACDDTEIALTRNATEALDNIISGIRLKSGDEVVLSKYDYPRMISAWKRREAEEGIVLRWVDFDFPENDPKKIISKYTSLFSEKTRLVQITHMINWSGQLIPAKQIAESAKQKGILVLLDAAHTFAQIPINLKEIPCDFMGASLHKWLCAPAGNGFLFIRSNQVRSIKPLFPAEPDLDNNISKFEQQGTMNLASQLAISDAIDFHSSIGIDRFRDRLFELKKRWTDKVRSHPKVKIFTPEAKELSGGIGLIGIEGKPGIELTSFLYTEYQIFASLIKYEKLDAARISPHVYTNESEIDTLAEAILTFADT